jgi:hypothetical protein
MREALLMAHVSSSTTFDTDVQPNPRAAIVERIRGEFREMPGLTLTLAQAVRLWSLDRSTCSDLLSHLVETGFLTLTADGAFCRATGVARSLRMAKAAIRD